MKLLKLIGITLFVSSTLFAQQGLTYDNDSSNTKIGAVLGAIAGAATGYNTKGRHKKKRAAIGAGAGALLGGGIGYLLDKQANEVASALGTGVSSDPLAALDPRRTILVYKTKNYVKLIFRDRMMFATGSSRLQRSARAKVNKVARLLRRYPKTVVAVAGFTDNKGSYSYNQKLSKRRALSVARLLSRNGRPYTKGCSYRKALASNHTARNRALNRRVEVYLYSKRTRMSDPCRR